MVSPVLESTQVSHLDLSPTRGGVLLLLGFQGLLCDLWRSCHLALDSTVCGERANDGELGAARRNSQR